MHLLLDERPCEIEAASIGEAIAGAAALAEDRGRVIVEVTVDGDLWNEGQLTSVELCGGVAEEIRCVSADLKTLVCRTLADAADALVRADELQREAAELIQADQHPPAMERLGDALGIWLTVHEAVVKSAEALELDLDAIRVADGPLRDCIDRLKGQLQALHGALQTHDQVAISDTLLYELPEVVADWREALDAVQSHVQGEQT